MRFVVALLAVVATPAQASESALRERAHARIAAVLSDAAFFASPVKVGEGVTLSWDKQDSIVLGRVEK